MGKWSLLQSSRRWYFPQHLLCARPVQGSRSTDIQRPEGRRGSTQKTRHVTSHRDSTGV